METFVFTNILPISRATQSMNAFHIAQQTVSVFHIHPMAGVTCSTILTSFNRIKVAGSHSLFGKKISMKEYDIVNIDWSYHLKKYAI